MTPDVLPEQAALPPRPPAPAPPPPQGAPPSAEQIESVSTPRYSVPGQTLLPPPTSGPTPFSELAGQLTQLQYDDWRDAATREKQARDEAAAQSEADAARYRAWSEPYMAEQQRRTAGLMQARPTLTEPPDLRPRPFLAPDPGESPMQSIEKFIQAIGLFGAGVGSMASGDARGGLAALTGALQGWQEGDQIRAQRGLAQWNAQTQKALKAWEIEKDVYDAWSRAEGLTGDTLLRQIELSARAAGNKALAAAAATGDAKQLFDALAKADENYKQLMLHYAQIQANTLIAQRRDLGPDIRAEMYALEEKGERPTVNQALIERSKRGILKETTEALLKAQQKTEHETWQTPIPVAQASKMMIPTPDGKLVRMPQGWSPGQAMRANAIEVDDKDLEAFSDLNQTNSLVQVLKATVDPIITARTWDEAIGQKARITADWKSNTRAMLYENQKKAFLGTMTRALGGQRGVLTDQDINMTLDAFPTFSDTRQIAQAKWFVINSLVSIASEARWKKMRKEPSFDEGVTRQRIDELKLKLAELDADGKKSQPGGPWTRTP